MNANGREREDNLIRADNETKETYVVVVESVSSENKYSKT